LDKSKYQEQFTLPDPIELLNARNIALKQSFCALPELWDIKDNEVVLNESEAFVYIHSQSIYANDPKQIEFCNQLDTFVKLFTKIDTSLKGKFSQPTPFTYQFCRGKFEVKETENSFYEIKIIPEILRTWLRDLK
jgi:hypothetical protein